MKTADLPDDDFLAAVDHINDVKVAEFGGTIGASRWDVEGILERYPEKIVIAKASKLVRRGALHGCACGCRGDFTRT